MMLPPDMRDCIPKDHIEHFINEVESSMFINF